MLRPKKPKRMAVLFLRDLPADLKAQFKAYCSVRGTTMKAQLMKFMAECVMEDFEHEPDKRRK